LHFFLRKAESVAKPVKIDEKDFRYPGQTSIKEAAIMMLAIV